MPKIDRAAIQPNANTGYPKPFDTPVQGRLKKDVGGAGGLNQFGTKLITLLPANGTAKRQFTRKDGTPY